MTTAKGHFGSVTFDGESVRIEKKLRGTQMVPIQAISAVSIERAGIGMRAIRFSVAGGTAAQQSVALGSRQDFANDPFAVLFRKGSAAEFEALAAEIQKARAVR